MNRSRKIAIIISLILGLFSFKTFSLGAGFQVGLIPALDINQDNIKLDDFETNITGTIKLFRIPGTLGLGLNIGKENSLYLLGLAGFIDYWTIDYQIKNTWNIYSGCGIYSKFMVNSNSKFQISLGPRFFLGCNWLFVDNFIEFYTQITTIPTYVRNISDHTGFIRVNIPFETGLRFHY